MLAIQIWQTETLSQLSEKKSHVLKLLRSTVRMNPWNCEGKRIHDSFPVIPQTASYGLSA